MVGLIMFGSHKRVYVVDDKFYYNPEIGFFIHDDAPEANIPLFVVEE